MNKLYPFFLLLCFLLPGLGSEAQAQSYNMSNTPITTCSGNWYDTGGSAGNYQNSENLTQTFTPSTGGAMLRFTFSMFQTEGGYDYLTIYDGPSTASPIIGTYNGSTGPGVVTATNPTGQLTFRFTSDGSVVYQGWAAAITCIGGAPCAGTPAPGNTVSSANPVCPSENFTLSTQNLAPGSGITYQWQSADDAAFTSNVQNLGTAPTQTASQTSAKFYRATVTCTNTSQSATSTPVQVNMGSVAFCSNYTMSSTPITTCGGNWYDTGGSAGSYANNVNVTQTFTPSTANSMLQFSFSSFLTEGCCDFLTIYNGPTTASPIIGTYSGTNSPGVVTASNPTGQLTFRFTTDGSVTGPGWAATISCLGPCDGTPAPGNTTTTANPVCPFTSFTLSVQNIAPNPGYTYQLQSSTDGINYSDVPGATGTSYTITQSAATYYQWLVICTISQEATFSDALLINMDSPVTCSNINMSNAPITTCSGNFYDTGGSTGSYQNSENLTQTFTPATAGSMLQFSFSSFQTESCCDFLTIYNGPNTSSPVIGTYGGNTNPGVVTANNPTGQLTFRFTSDGSVTGSGWAAAITCLAPCTGTPAPGNTISSASPVCPAEVFTLSTQNTSVPGLTYQWQSADNVGFTSNVQNLGTAPTQTASQTSAKFYRATVTCPASSQSAPSTPVQVTMHPASACVNYNMSNTPITTCSGNFYDTGGSSGSYQNNENLTQTFTPSTGGAMLRFTFSSFQTEGCCDFLTIYDGPNTSSPIIGSYGGTTSPGMVTATNPTGQLTFRFTSDGSVLGSGWAASISCIGGSPCAGTPAPGNTVSSANPVCPGVNFTLSTQNIVNGSGITYQWQSADNVGFTSNVQNLGTAPTQTTSQISAKYYRVTATCTNSGLSATSTPVLVNMGTVTFCSNYTMSSTPITTCSGNWYDTGGSTGNYANNVNVTQTFTPATAGSMLRFTFSMFETESCCDFLTIYNGPNTSSPIIGTYGGTTSPGVITASNPTGQLTFRFTTDGSVTGQGWAAAITCVTGGGGGNNYTMSSTPVTTCSGNWYDTGGSTGNYANNVNVTQTFTPATAGSMLRFTFSMFETESCCDFLTIYNGPNTSSPIIGTYGGTTSPGVITASNPTGQLTFRFTSDGSVTGQGWAAAITCVTGGGGGNNYTMSSTPITTCSGNWYDTGGSTGNYANNVNVTQTFTPATAGSMLRFSFSMFETESCCDFLTIYNGPNTSSPIIGTYGGTTSPGVITASNPTGQLTFRFTTDGSVTGQGWAAAITCVTGGGGGTYTMNSSPVTTCSGNWYDPGGTGPYANNADVTQTFTPATAGSMLRFTFSAFYTENGFDFLTIYNGPNTSSPIIGTYSGTTGPGVVTASNATGQLTFRFISDGSVTADGWNAAISCVSGPVQPTIISFSPSSGPVGTTVTVSGTNFTGATSVTIGGVPATFTVNSSGSLTLIVPPGAVTGPITVTTANGTATSTTSFTVTNPTGVIVMSNTPITTCSGTWYDQGGTGPYANNLNQKQTFTPSQAGYAIRVSFSSFETEGCCDFLNIYNGPNTSAPLLGTYSGFNSPGVVMATNPTGELTFHFTSDDSFTGPGWEALISCELISATPGNARPGGLSLFPNPTTGQLTVILPDAAAEVTVSVVNMLGQQVSETRLQPTASDNSLNLNIGHLPKGVYVVLVDNGLQVYRQKVVLE